MYCSEDIGRTKENKVVISCLAHTTISAKTKEERDKRNIEYQISHPYLAPTSYRLERRISSGPHQYQNPSQIYSRPYHKGRPYSYPIPPYAVQMEPLVHYSQRDPLYDTNILSLDPHNDDLLTENNHIQDNVDRYGYHKPHIIERPVYIKEPEPIIEIIIKESNVSLPAPPPPPPPPKKKKEQVQVFYVKYQKNPHGSGKDSILYDKPVLALSPKIPDDHEQEEEPAPYNDYLPESATAPPAPSTTLRTIIKPDSEVYHSPSGVKVTFGKEGFDYDKRSSKPEDYVPLQSTQFPQGRQLTSFSNAYFKRPSTIQNYQTITSGFTRSDARQPQSYRTINFPPNSPPSNYKPFSRPTTHYQQQSKYYQGSQFSRPNPDFNSYPPQPPVPPQYSHTISHPPPVRFQNPRPTPPPARQPVPYKPFENFRPQQNIPQPTSISSSHPQQPVQFRPETHFPPHQQLPLTHQSHTFNPPRFSQPLPQYNSQEISENPSQHSQPSQNQQQYPNHQQQHQYQQSNYLQQQSIQQQPNLALQHQANSQQSANHQVHHNQFHNNQNYQNQQPQGISQNEHLNNVQAVQNILPPGGQLIQSVPKYEQHISSVEPPTLQQAQGASAQQYQQKNIQQYHQNSAEQNSREVFHQQESTSEHQRRVLEDRHRQQQHQEQLRQFYHKNPDIQQRSQHSEAPSTPRSDAYHSSRNTQSPSSTPRLYYQTTTAASTSSTTKEPETPSTTTKDPKVLEAQLPDEVPAELREQLLSSGILNNADISILDYDKVGDIPLSALPPDQLANFYGAGGAAQLASDLTPLDFYVWGPAKGLVYATEVSTRDVLVQRIETAFDTIKEEIRLRTTTVEIRNRCRACIRNRAGSEPVPSLLRPESAPLVSTRPSDNEEDAQPAGSESEEVVVPAPSVNLKVVRYNPDTEAGQKVQDKYVASENAHHVDPVVLNDSTYNRYLPLKVNGTQFPIPDVPELKGKKISSVVVLAPVTYDFSSDRKTRQTSRQVSTKSSDIELIEGTALKDLLTNPSSENYRRFLDSENKTRSDKQSVILLVADSDKGREIYMYDVATQTVSKLSGELSSAFVEAAEANSEDEAQQVAASNTIENIVAYRGEIDRHDLEDDELAGAASDIDESKGYPVMFREHRENQGN
ncbi:unnamed protein product [Phaedon cochleariae]|uniref:Uncharacterized protein n=1 Tax=Phaedon cochleariae TaxID=80249 RepID=A0A9N9SB35_PHACE|nr:unnamed protein product [Phaedon cochleariae]